MMFFLSFHFGLCIYLCILHACVRAVYTVQEHVYLYTCNMYIYNNIILQPLVFDVIATILYRCRLFQSAAE